MKKSILLNLLIFLSFSMYSQRKFDFAYYDSIFESEKAYFSTKQWKKISTRMGYFERSELNDREKKILIDKIGKLFEQKDYANLYRLGHRIIYNMWNLDELENRKLLTDLHLRYYFYPGRESIIGCGNENAKYYTQKSKERLVEIIEERKTDDEYNAWFAFNRSIYNADPEMGWREVSVFMNVPKQNDTVSKQVRDSIIDSYIHRGAKADIASLKIDPCMIQTTGLLNIKECIPALNRGLLHCIENDSEEIQTNAYRYRYALAKLGDREQRQYIIDNLLDINNFDVMNLSYFHDDEMTWKYIEENYNSDRGVRLFSDSQPQPAYFMTMCYIYPFIKNLPKKLKYPVMSNDEDVLYQWAKSLYQWLKANKKSVKFDYDGEKEFPMGGF